MPFAAIVQRIRSFPLSIGQLTFASFMLLLAMIVMTSVASVVSIRHIDTTFAELQRLQSLGDLAEEIERRMSELRLAASDFVTDPAVPVQPGLGGGFRAERSLEENPAGACPRPAGNDRRRPARLQNYREGIERVSALIARRAELVAALPPVRERFEAAIAAVPDRITARNLFRTQNQIAAALAGARSSGAEQSAQRMRALADW